MVHKCSSSGRRQIQTVTSEGPSVISIVVADLFAGLNVPCGHEKYDRFILHKVQSRTEIGRVFNLSAKRCFVWMAVAVLVMSIQTHALSILVGEEKQMSSLCLVVPRLHPSLLLNPAVYFALGWPRWPEGICRNKILAVHVTCKSGLL